MMACENSWQYRRLDTIWINRGSRFLKATARFVSHVKTLNSHKGLCSRPGAEWQAVAGRKVAAAYFDVSPFENAEVWNHLRDVEEHWHEREKGMKVRARNKWEQLGLTGMPGREVSGKGHHLISLSELSVETLERDLLTLQKNISTFLAAD